MSSDAPKPVSSTGPSLSSENPAQRQDSPNLVEHYFRHEFSRLVASLTRRFGVRYLGLAEDAVQSALERALRTWPSRGTPSNPAAWLHQVACHFALDVLRRDLRWSSLDANGATMPITANSFPTPSSDEIQDDMLRMIFVCCDPELPNESQVALALKTLCGFHSREIARAFLTNEAVIDKRIVRAKERLRTNGVNPSELSSNEITQRLPEVQSVIYLVFNEGYSSTQPDRMIRDDLCEEAVRLALILAEHPLTSGTQTAAFLALLLFHAGRLDSRLDTHGALCLLDNQDRSRWNWKLIGEAFRWFGLATTGSVVTRYHAEAWVAAEHCKAANVGQTSWSAIVDAYELLVHLAPSPIHELNRAIAISQRDGVEAAKAALLKIPADRMTESYHLWHATFADFAIKTGDYSTAKLYLQRAIELAPTDLEKQLLKSRLNFEPPSSAINGANTT